MPAKLLLSREPQIGLTPVLCIPGTFCSPEIFDLIDETSLPNMQLLPVSWMTSPGPWDISCLGARIAELVHELDLGQALVVGHSTGGAIALAAALADPTMVKGLLLADTGAHMRRHGNVTSILQEMETAGSRETLITRLFQNSFHTSPELARAKSLIAYAVKVPDEAVVQALSSQAALDLTDQLASITMPVVVIHGTLDKARPLEFAEHLMEHLPNAELRLVDTGHMPMLEDPEKFTDALRRLGEMAAV